MQTVLEQEPLQRLAADGQAARLPSSRDFGGQWTPSGQTLSRRPMFRTAAAAVEARFRLRRAAAVANVEEMGASTRFAEHYQCRSCLSRDLAPHRRPWHPAARQFLSQPRRADEMEPTYPLPLLYCANCHLVQIPAATNAHAIFSDYLYMSSYAEAGLIMRASIVEEVTPPVRSWSAIAGHRNRQQ